MNILYDNQIFTWQRFGGISRYFVELIKNLDADVEYKLPLFSSDNQYLEDNNLAQYRHLFGKKDFKGKKRIVSTLNNMAFDRALRRNIVDIVHPTYYDQRFLGHIGSRPFVLTVHDMTHEVCASFFHANDSTSLNKKTLCKKASKIITVSHNTKKDLVELFGVNPNKIEVIHLGQSFSRSTDQTLYLPDRYVLFTGQRGGYKNFDRFVRAFAMLHDIDLICTGSPFSASELALFKTLGISARVRSIFVTDSEMSELYSRASLFVFPSLYEGFGIPILEAFAALCPVALSNRSSFPEIAQGAGAYFDPSDIDSIYETMNKVISDDKLRENMTMQGAVELAKFSWQNMGRRTCETYKSVI